MPNYPFVYQATIAWYEDGKSSHYRVAGVGFCSSFADATRQIEEREGENLESIEHLEMIGDRDETLIQIHPGWVRPLIDTESWDFMLPYTPEGK